LKPFMRGFLLATALWSCAAAKTIPWPYYGLEAVHYEGRLRAIDPNNDKDLSMCIPDPGKKGKCIVMLGTDFYKLKADDISCHSDLMECQRGR